MRVCRTALSLLLVSPIIVRAFAQETWRKAGTAADAYQMVSAAGVATDRAGATISLKSQSTVPPNGFGVITAILPADTFRMHRVRLSADIDAKDVTVGASPWLRIDGPTLGTTLALDNAQDRAVKGTSSGHVDITLFVPSTASSLVFGLLLSGGGEATARNLKIEALSGTALKTSAVARTLLDSAIALVRSHSLWRDTVTWSAVVPEVEAAAAGSQTTADVYPAIGLLLTHLGDHHSFLMRPSATQQFKSGGAQNARPEVRMLDDHIGYLSMPAYSGSDRDAMHVFARGTQDSIAAIQPRASCRWVVDLRRNSGGNMWPMLGGLRPFLGEAGLGSFVSAAGSAPLWHAGDAVDVKPTPQLAALESAYVAVLTGPLTASSGEAVTISFRERPRTRSFGLPTAGLSTANSGFALPDGSMIFLTTAVEADRAGHGYGQKIEPDEAIMAAPAGSAADPPLARAIAWLKSQPTC